MAVYKSTIFRWITIHCLFSVYAFAAHAENGWLNGARWTESGAYKECSGIIFNRCWFDTNIYTNVNSARLGDLVVVYNKKSKDEIARFKVKGIFYEASTRRCWVSAKSGKEPDTYLTALGCY